MLLVQVTMRDIPNSVVLENHIRDRAQKLPQFYQNIHNCKVVVEVPQKHKKQGRTFAVRIDLSVPGKDLVTNHKEDEDVYIAVRDAFNAIERQLEKYARRKRGDVKAHHENLSRGYITRLFPEDGFGFIQGHDGNEFYFNAKQVSHRPFDKLVVGDIVHFIELQADDGLQAQHVTFEKHGDGFAQ